MAYFPMFIELENRLVLVTGGGQVALRKIQKLRTYRAKITVVAPDILKEIQSLPDVHCIQREFRDEDLECAPVLVIAATNQKTVNTMISKLCQERNIPVNVVDDVDNCSFLFPALVKKGEFSAGICTGGASPTASVYYKERLKELLPDNLDEILDWLEKKRPELKEKIPQQGKRAGIFSQLFELCVEKGRPLHEEEWITSTNISTEGSVALVGAGCGKADLITVRGLRLLKRCEAVVYDDLIDPELLEAVPESAMKIYMGKRSGSHSASQEEINRMLIELARMGKRVVRLKGGDPYLFGRGGEEMQALRKAGISCQEVPGIPSAIGIPAEAGIPVTHRGASRGLHIVTAHTSDTEDGLPKDFDTLVQLSGTLVFLMGLKQLPRIVERLMAAGKSGETPVAVLSGGNSKNPASVRAMLHGICEAVKKARVTSPAIILIGEVAAFNFNESENPLCAVRVGITGTERIAKKQEQLLQKLGAETVWLSRSVVRERDISLDVRAWNEKPCWLVFTSENGVRVFFRQTEKQKVCWEEMKNVKFAVIGEATGQALSEYGIRYDLCPKVFTSEALAKALVSVVEKEEEIRLLRSSIGSPALAEIPRQSGLRVTDIPIYDLEREETKQELPDDIRYLTFSSASGVRLFFEQYGRIPENITCVCIGEVTAKELKKYGETKFLMAKEALVESMVEMIVEDYNRVLFS